jgi:hypothetical protein
MGRWLTARGSRQELLDISGRRVAELHAGPNDVSRLAPGIYFLHSRTSTTRKVIVTE